MKNISSSICGLLIACVISLTGCQTGMFANAKFPKPNLSKLAFWKKGDVSLASNELPPPSAHFDPEPSGFGEKSSEIASDLQSRVDDILATADKQKSDMLNTGEPFRKPYSLDSVDSDLANKDNSFKANADSNSNKADPAAALKSLTDSLKNLQSNTESRVKQSSNAFVASANDMKTKASDTIAGWKNDFDLPRKRLSDSAGQVASEAGRAVNNAFEGASDTMAAMSSSNRPVQQARNGFGGSLSNPNSSGSNSFAPAMNSANPQINQNNQFANRSTDDSLARPPHDVLHPIDSSTTSNSAGLANSSKSGTSSSYPTTPYGRIQPRVAPASGNSFNPNSAVVRAGGTSDSPRVARHQGNAIPTVLLEGSNNFAPGSVKMLQPINKDWQAPSSGFKPQQ